MNYNLYLNPSSIQSKSTRILGFYNCDSFYTFCWRQNINKTLDLTAIIVNAFTQLS